MKYYLAIDIGGTKTAIGVYDESGAEKYHGRIVTEPNDGCAQLIERLFRMTQDVLKEYAVVAGGIACPGPLDVESGTVNNTTTLGWVNVPIVQMFSEKFKLPFTLINDCNAGAYGEYKMRNCRNMVYISISTGIGGGIIADGKLYNGQGNAAEFGHLHVRGGKRLKCGCGREDCLELYASGTAVESEYYRLMGKTLSGVDIADLANIGDPVAVAIYNEVAEYIAEAVVDIQKVLDPETIVIGGGVADAIPFRKNPSFQKLGQYGVNVKFSNLNGRQVLLGTMYYIRDSGVFLGKGESYERHQEILRQ